MDLEAKNEIPRMVRFFLRAKHWQVFTLVWGTYFAGQILLTRIIPAGPITAPRRVGITAELVMLPFIACFLSWIWSLGSYLYSISEWSLNLNFFAFRFAVIFSTLFFLSGVPLLLSSNTWESEYIVIPLILFSMCCVLYAFLFVAKTLTSLEKSEDITSNEHAKYFLLLLASFVGIWIIQPKINGLYARNS